MDMTRLGPLHFWVGVGGGMRICFNRSICGQGTRPPGGYFGRTLNTLSFGTYLHFIDVHVELGLWNKLSAKLGASCLFYFGCAFTGINVA